MLVLFGEEGVGMTLNMAVFARNFCFLFPILDNFGEIEIRALSKIW